MNAAASTGGPPQVLDFSTDAESVGRAMDSFLRMLPPGLPPEQRHGLQIALGEALGNIARHGYAGRPGAVHLEVLARGDEIEVVLCDWGVPVPARNWEAASASVFDFDPARIDELPESGMGLALIRMGCDALRYESRDESQDGCNRLRLVKSLKEHGAGHKGPEFG